MKVAIDAQLTVGTATGIGEYVCGLIGALGEAGIEVAELKEPSLDPWRFDRRVFWDQVLLPQRARRSAADVLHCASGTMPLSLDLPAVVTVHDVAWLRVQAHARPYARYYFGRFAVERYRKARAIVVDSYFSRRELLDVIPGLDESRVRVAYPGVARDFCDVARRDGDRCTILSVGTVERRKNLEALIHALPSLAGARIVSVGPATPYLQECRALAQTLGVDDRIEFRGYVERAKLLELYATCAVVAMPSTYEGFGYGAAQAMCAGVPCIVSERSSLPEIAGTDARVVSLDDPAGWRASLASALQGDDDERARSVRAEAIGRFGWRNSVKEIVSAYELALS